MFLKRFILLQQGYKTLRMLQQSDITNSLLSITPTVCSLLKPIMMAHWLGPGTVNNTACPIRAFARR